MAMSAAKPAGLLAYRDGGLAQVAAWEPEVTTLAEALEALEALRTALAGRELPEECQVTVLFLESWFETLTRNQRHLDEWVGDVDLVPSRHPTRIERTPAAVPGRTVRVDLDGWIFPRSGVAFVWTLEREVPMKQRGAFAASG